MPIKIKKKRLTEAVWSEDLLSAIQDGKTLDISEILPLVTPGEILRNGLDEILQGQIGALIVLGTNSQLEGIIRGGIKLDIPFTPARLFELSKMDGAIIISNDLKKILYANAHLMPDREISSQETGIRHRSAEQTARQTKLPVIAISKRRGLISLFYRDQKYVLQDVSLLLAKANHSLNMLRNYRSQIDSDLDKFTYSELTAVGSLGEDAIEMMQAILYFYKHNKQLENLIIELGNQGEEINETLLEYATGLEEELSGIIQDYSEPGFAKADADFLLESLKVWDLRKISDNSKLAEITRMNYLNVANEAIATQPLKYPRGYRVLSKISKVSRKVVEKLLHSKIYLSDIIDLDENELVKKSEVDIQTIKHIKQKLAELTDSLADRVASM